jgi:hypothetical protein
MTPTPLRRLALLALPVALALSGCGVPLVPGI